MTTRWRFPLRRPGRPPGPALTWPLARPDFFGRRAEIEIFRRNLRRRATDRKRWFLLNIYGLPGVGKTELLSQFISLAAKKKILCAYLADVNSVSDAMAAIADQLGQQGTPLGAFMDRLTRQHEQERGGPQGAATLTPQVDRLLLHTKSRMGSRDDIDLLNEPTQVLTREFVQDLRLASARARIELFFDTDERTGPLLDSWLRTLLTACRRPPAANVTITVAGRQPLDTNMWASILGEWIPSRLQPFSGRETQRYLANHKIRDEHLVTEISRLSEGLPIAVAILAAARPANAAAVQDPARTVVRRFLNWVDDQERRDAAMLAALPRKLDEDVLACLLPRERVEALSRWLRSLPFDDDSQSSWRYHDAVRGPMLRLQRSDAPARWTELQARLAGFNQQRRDAVLNQGWTNPTWRSHHLEETYHRLCAEGDAALPEAASRTIWAYRLRRADAREWAATVRQSGLDGVSERLTQIGKELLEFAQDEHDGWTEFFTRLLRIEGIDRDARAEAFLQRADRHVANKRWELAVADDNQAIQLDRSNARAVTHRGQTYYLMNRYSEAYADFTKAVELNDSYAWAFALRGATCGLLKGADAPRYDEALENLDRAIALDPALAWAFARRGATHSMMGDYEAALLDFDRATAEDSSLAWAYALKGQAQYLKGDFPSAVQAFDEALDIDGTLAWAIALRGAAYYLIGDYQAALGSFPRAVTQYEPKWLVDEPRTGDQGAMSRFEEALPDFVHAIQLEPTLLGGIAVWADDFDHVGRKAEALGDFISALSSDPLRAWGVARGAILYQNGQYSETVDELAAAVQPEPSLPWATALLGETYRLLDRHHEALEILTQALTLTEATPGRLNDRILARRSVVFATLGRVVEAVADAERAVELAQGDSWILYSQGLVQVRIGLTDQSRGTFEGAAERGTQELSAEPRNNGLRLKVALYYVALHEYRIAQRLYEEIGEHDIRRGQAQKAIRDLTELLQLNPPGTNYIAELGQVEKWLKTLARLTTPPAAGGA
jgi:tetratricopeptide (TPR) repeat protein